MVLLSSLNTATGTHRLQTPKGGNGHHWLEWNFWTRKPCSAAASKIAKKDLNFVKEWVVVQLTKRIVTELLFKNKNKYIKAENSGVCYWSVTLSRDSIFQDCPVFTFSFTKGQKNPTPAPFLNPGFVSLHPPLQAPLFTHTFLSQGF